MNNLKGKKVLIFQQRRWAMSIGHFLAKKLQDEGCFLAALTAKKSTHDFILSQKEVKYEMIISSDEPKSNPKKFLNGEKNDLKEICAELGVDTIWPLVSAARFHVKSYKDKYYYGFKQNVSDEIIIEYIMAIFKYLKQIFQNFRPDIIIAPNFATLHHLMFNLYAQKQSIKMIALTDTKIRGLYVFSHGYKNDTGEFYDQIDALNNNLAISPNKQLAQKYISNFRKKFIVPDYCEPTNKTKKTLSFLQILRREISPYYQIFLWYIHKSENYLEVIGVTPDFRPPKIILRDHYSQKKYKKFANNFDYYPLEKIKKYVYFPLQAQPEETIDVLAPFFNNQIEIARLTAMSLPDDYTLVVKDHPGMIDKRTPSYLEKLSRTPNVKLVDYRLTTEEILKRADLVISPNSTTIAEAAFLSIPSIQFGDLGTTLKLPNNHKHTDMPSLSKKIKERLRTNLHNDEYEKKLENYVAAAYDTGLDLNYLKIWQEPGATVETAQEKLWNFYKKEILHLI